TVPRVLGNALVHEFDESAAVVAAAAEHVLEVSLVMPCHVAGERGNECRPIVVAEAAMDYAVGDVHEETKVLGNDARSLPVVLVVEILGVQVPGPRKGDPPADVGERRGVLGQAAGAPGIAP